MPQNLDQTIALLSRTPATLSALLRDLPDELTHTNEGAGTWSCFGVVGHLIGGERTDWIPRARIILQYGETRAFDPFDREGHIRECEGKTLRNCWMNSPACAPRIWLNYALGNSSPRIWPSTANTPRGQGRDV